MRWGVFIALLLTGCAVTGRIKAPDGTVIIPPGNASTPSGFNSGQKTTETIIPAGTQRETVKTAATATEPAKETTTYRFAKETKETAVEKTQSVTLANERQPDQTVALKKLENEENRPLLYAAMAAAVVAVVLLVMKWPGAASFAGLAAVSFFIAWKVAGLPPWFWTVGIGCLIAGAFMMLGYKRKEWDKDGDGIPDVLQSKKVVTETKTTVVEPTP